MGVIHWQDKDKDMGILYECDTDGKGNVTKTTYLDTKRQTQFLKKMVKNVARTVREELIQHPEVIPVFLEFIAVNKEEFPDSIFDGNEQQNL